MTGPHSVHCPKCSHIVSVRVPSTVEMRDELLALAGRPPSNRYGTLNKEDLTHIYKFVIQLAEKSGYVCPVPGE